MLVNLFCVHFFWIGSKWPVKAAAASVEAFKVIRDVNFSHDMLDTAWLHGCMCGCSSFNLNFLDFVMVANCCAATIYLCYCRVSSRRLYRLLCCQCFLPPHLLLCLLLLLMIFCHFFFSFFFFFHFTIYVPSDQNCSVCSNWFTFLVFVFTFLIFFFQF